MKQLVFTLLTFSLAVTLGCTDRSSTKALQNQPAPQIESTNVELEKQDVPVAQNSNSSIDQTIARIVEVESMDSSAQDAQLALRITDVNFDINNGRTPELSLKTYSGIKFDFTLEKIEGSVFHFSKSNNSSTDSYTAQAKKIDDSIYILTIEETESAALIKILYIKKVGISKILLQPKLNYKKLLGVGSYKFIERVRENPIADAEFYMLLSEIPSEISRFDLKISDLFKLTLKFDESRVKNENLLELPTIIDGLGFWRDLRFRSSSYKYTNNYTYVLGQNHLHPIFYNQMNFKLEILAMEKIAGSKTVPAKLEISFEKK